MTNDTTNIIIPENWKNILFDSLKSDLASDKLLALDFLSKQSSLELNFARQIMPLILNNIHHPESSVRYFARKARNHFLDCFSEIESETKSKEPLRLEIRADEAITSEKILLHKLRLGSRYVVFEAMERLTESGDPSLVTSLLDYLKEEKDEYKVSYLLKLLCRIDDKRIPEILVSFLDCEDPRIVANALESLCFYDTPDLEEKLIDFATSSDNRIRVNAIKGLYKYAPDIAEKHIAEMVNHDNITLQHSGVYLLKVLRPSNLAELLEVANCSKYATVRLKALDIRPPSAAELEIKEYQANEDIEQPNPRQNFTLLSIFLATAAVVLLLANTSNKLLLSVLFLVIAIITLFMHERTRTSIQKTAISMGFISSLAWGNTRLMVLPALMGLWLTWNGNLVNKEGKLEKAKAESIFAWFFAVGAIIITQLVQGETALVLNLAAKLADTTKNISEPVLELISKQGHFDMLIFTFVSAMTILIMKFNSWFPAKSTESNPTKKLFVGTIICLVIVLALNYFHVWGVQLRLSVDGFGSMLGLLKKLMP